MKNKFILLIFFSFTVFINSCCDVRTTPLKIKDISFNIDPLYAIVPNGIECAESHLLIVQSLEDMKLHVISFDSSGSFKKSILSNKQKFSNPFFQVYVKNFDSIILFNQDMSTIDIVDTNGNYLFRKKLLKDLPTTNPNNPIHCIGNNIFLGNSEKESNVGIEYERNKYYNTTCPVYQISMKDTNNFTIKTWGKFPHKYLIENKDYCDYFPNICEFSNSEIILSYGSDDSIYLYKNGLKTNSFLCKSKYIDRFKFVPEEKRLDLSFYKTFISSEPKYLKVVFNKFSNQFYRIVKHRFKYINNRLDINTMTWSIIILDENLNVLDEVFFKYQYYTPDIILCTPEGIYVSNVSNSNNESLKLSLFDFYK